jgi:hypothetical protein
MMTLERQKRRHAGVMRKGVARLHAARDLEEQARILEAEVRKHLQRTLSTADDEPHLPAQQENGDQQQA